MKALNIGNKEIKLYDSIDEMPICNFQKYNKYILLDSGIGSDIDDVDSHLIRISKLVKTDSAKALQELQNMRQNMHMIVSNISPKYLAFAALIHSVDGKKIEDLSDDTLKRVLEEIKDVKHGALVDILEWLKKKLQAELETYFPSEFEDAKEKEAFDRLKRRTLLVLRQIIEDTDLSDEIQEIDDYSLSLYKPKIFFGKKSVEIQYDKQFENSCLLISKETGSNAKSMTVLQYYNALELIKKETDAKLKVYKRR